MRPSPVECARKIRRMTGMRPAWAVVLGSGYQMAAGPIKVVAELQYAQLPGFSRPGVPGHGESLLAGELGGAPVFVLRGRTHYYEGRSLEEVTFPIRVLAEMGVGSVLLTNAAGAINRRFRPGDFMVLRDHLNWMGVNPLRGCGADGFVDLTAAYDPELRKALLQAGRACGLRMRNGTYLAVAGPSYETPAEIRAFARLGADAVGMSTVPEVIVARQCGLRVAALSCLSNFAAGLGPGRVSHEEVLATMRSQEKAFGNLLERLGGQFAG